jgi:PAS domain S-box-containing protein
MAEAPGQKHRPRRDKPFPSRLRQILEAAPTAVFVARRSDSRYVYANRLALELIGYDEQELYQKHVADLTAVDPKRVANGQFLREGRARGSRTILHKDGHSIHGAFSAVVATPANFEPVMISFVRSNPITARWESFAPAEESFALSAQELSVLQLMIEGLSDEDIGLLQGVPTESVRSVAQETYRKLGVSSRTAACVRAMQANLV